MLAGLAAAGAWRIVERETTPRLDLTQPDHVAALVASTYGLMPDMPPVAITTREDASAIERIDVDRSGAVRFEHYATRDAPSPTRIGSSTGRAWGSS